MGVGLLILMQTSHFSGNSFTGGNGLGSIEFTHAYNTKKVKITRTKNINTLLIVGFRKFFTVISILHTPHCGT